MIKKVPEELMIVAVGSMWIWVVGLEGEIVFELDSAPFFEESRVTSDPEKMGIQSVLVPVLTTVVVQILLETSAHALVESLVVLARENV
jgi:hypothetical protein